MNWKKLGLLSVLAGSLALSSGVVSEVGAQGTDETTAIHGTDKTTATVFVDNGALTLDRATQAITFAKITFSYELYKQDTLSTSASQIEIVLTDDRFSTEAQQNWDLRAALDSSSFENLGDVQIELTNGSSDSDQGFTKPTFSKATLKNDNVEHSVFYASRTEADNFTGAGTWTLTIPATLDIPVKSLTPGTHSGTINWTLTDGIETTL